MIVLVTSVMAISEVKCNGSNCNGKDYQINDYDEIKFNKNDLMFITAENNCPSIETINVTFIDEVYNNYKSNEIKTPSGIINNPAIVFGSYKIILPKNNCIDYYAYFDRDNPTLNLTYIYGLEGLVRFESTIFNEWLSFLTGYGKDITKGYPINDWINMGLTKYAIQGYNSLNTITLLSGTLNIGDLINITILNNMNETFNYYYQILNNNTILVTDTDNNQFTITNSPLNNITTITYNGFNYSFDNQNINNNNIFVNASGVYYGGNVFFNQSSITYISNNNSMTVPFSQFNNITNNINPTININNNYTGICNTTTNLNIVNGNETSEGVIVNNNVPDTTSSITTAMQILSTTIMDGINRIIDKINITPPSIQQTDEKPNYTLFGLIGLMIIVMGVFGTLFYFKFKDNNKEETKKDEVSSEDKK